MLSGAICDSILRFLGTTEYLAVAKLTNFGDLRTRLSLPSALLATQRFHAAVNSSRFDWVASGPLSGAHAALVVPASAASQEWAVASALHGFNFDDPWGTGESVELFGVGVVVALEGFSGLAEVFAAVDEALVAAETAQGRGRGDENRCEKWCNDVG
jgi:hypothetical protein